MESLVAETFNMALLDSGCTKTVFGEAWLQHYVQSLSYNEYQQLETLLSPNLNILSLIYLNLVIIRSLKV